MEQTKQLTELAKLIRSRRSVKKGYNDRTVEKQTVLDLLESAVWAPTHGLRQPWRYIFVGADQKEAFAKKVAATYPEEKQENREAYLNEPSAFLVVVMDVPDNQKQYDENFGATASMIHNFQLLAWEQQLGVVWKTNPHIYDPVVKTILDVHEDEKIVGFVHMGYFDEAPIAKPRKSVEDKFTTFEG
ncbi:nitroreductase [Virgibacillus phasianinus]|uniref:Putative NAD(P)H nitroreductase n=1 Tax=Virgibacillus phasianinus TaxID=2017483 RepID=A0A220U0J7_9BACI|nr:nitroreductase [Virgibacillus phasianinus]ASK61453.1 nitroreductase [Virgibacillus phasianinus]